MLSKTPWEENPDRWERRRHQRRVLSFWRDDKELVVMLAVVFGVVLIATLSQWVK